MDIIQIDWVEKLNDLKIKYPDDTKSLLDELTAYAKMQEEMANNLYSKQLANLTRVKNEKLAEVERDHTNQLEMIKMQLNVVTK